MGEDGVSNELTASNESNALMAVIERVAMSENADIAKLEKMLDMQERVLNRNAAQSFTADMAMMQGEMPRVFKLATGHNTTYARLEDINDTVRPVLQKFGFAVTFNIDQPSPKDVKVTAILSHREGHKETSSLTLPCDTSGSKNAVQAVGSTISYGKRYSMCALLNISTGDDTNGFKLGDVQGEKPVGVDALAKPTISEDGLLAAAKKILAGELTLDRLVAARELTGYQLQYIEEILANKEV